MPRYAPPKTRPGVLEPGTGYTSYEGGIERFIRLTEPMTVEVYLVDGGFAYWYEHDRFGLRYQCRTTHDLVRYSEDQ